MAVRRKVLLGERDSAVVTDITTALSVMVVLGLGPSR
jgi:hypothetical protein